MSHPAPPFVQEAMLDPQTTVTRRVEVYEQDYSTVYMEDAPFLTGQVSIDMSRDERRTLDLTLDNSEGQIIHDQGEFWYDKIIKPYRGIVAYDPLTAEPTHWETGLGEFMIDSISSAHFPNQITVQGRDHTKHLLNSKFQYATNFPEGQAVLGTIKAIAQSGGIERFVIPPIGPYLSTDFTFEPDTERWKAIVDIATAFGYEVFFDSHGYMVVREFRDPTKGPVTYEFKSGERGNLASWAKTSNDTRLHNIIVVTGESSETIPYTATASNTAADSPTSVDEIGERVYFYKSPYITSEAQAQDLADKFLKVHALEEYSIDLETIVLPWLEAGDIIEFAEGTGSNPNAPTQFLLSSLTIPLSLGTMSVNAKRVALVGG